MGISKINEDELMSCIKEISSGNDEALRYFYDSYGGIILSLILTMVKTRESGEEVLQDVLMTIVLHDPDKPLVNARAWLYKVVRNQSMKKLKEDISMQTEPLSEYEDITYDKEITEDMENSEEQAEALKYLDELERKIIIMSVFWDLKLPQVARLLGEPYERVRNKYSYAMKKLKNYYEERRKQT